ncbi:MAG: hypothetical protein ACI9PD_001718, partial [Psychrobacter glaciei]
SKNRMVLMAKATALLIANTITYHKKYTHMKTVIPMIIFLTLLI